MSANPREQATNQLPVGGASLVRAACGILPRAAGFRCAHCWTAAGELFAIASLGSLLAAEPSYALRIAWLHRIVARHAAASQRGSVRWHCAGRAGQQLGAALQFPGAESKEHACGKTSVRTVEFRFGAAHGGEQYVVRACLRSAARVGGATSAVANPLDVHSWNV